MKKTFLSISLPFLISFSLFAQDSGQKNLGSIGFSYSSFGNIQDTRNETSRYYGYAGGTYGYDYYIEKMFYTIGINYLKPLNSWLEYETGLEYSRKTGSLKTVFPFDDIIMSKANSTLMSFPLTVRANFLRFFYGNVGVLMDLDLGGYNPSRYQSGIGYLFGVAAKYDFKFGGSIYINPYFKKRSLISFSSNEDRLKVDEAGIRVGLNYKLDKIR
jgi:hypothetical protein